MATATSTRKNILLITDSRGKYLQGYLNHHNRNFSKVVYTVEVHKGSKLQRLWRFAKPYLSTRSYDLIYIYGGICDITQKQRLNGETTYWPNINDGPIGADLISLYHEIANEYANSPDRYTTKMCFIPEVGGNFIVYNQVPYTDQYIEMQSAIELSLPGIQKAAKDANTLMAISSPWSLDTLYRRNKRGVLVPEYQRLADGIHPSQRMAEKLAIILIKHAHEVFLLGKPSTGQLVNGPHQQL